MPNADRFTIVMFMLIVLVIVVVSASQFQQFQLSSIAVTKTKDIERSVNTTLHNLNDFENSFQAKNGEILTNISLAHDMLLRHVEESDHLTQNRSQILHTLLEDQTSKIIQQLREHVNDTAENLKRTKINAFNIKANTDLLRALMENRTIEAITPTTKNTTE